MRPNRRRQRGTFFARIRIDAGRVGHFPGAAARACTATRDAARDTGKDLGIWQTLTWSQVAEHVRQVAHGLAASGIRPGMHVAVIGENRPRLYMAMMAAQSLGAIPVPLYQDAVAQEMVYVLQDAEVSVAVVEDQEQVDKMLEVREQCPALQRVVYDDPRGLRHYADPMLMSYEQLEALGQEYAAQHPDFFARAVAAVKPHDPAAMFYTSGTTGKPKGVVLTHHALIDRARAVSDMEQLTDREDVLAYLPPAWIGQNMFSYTQLLVTGFTVNHPESPDTVSIDMRDIGPTYYFAPPRVLEGLLTHVMIRMEDAGVVKRKLFHACMKLARRVGTRILDGESVGLWDRLRYALGNALIYGPLRNALGMSRVRVAYTAGEAIGPDLFVFYRSIGINLKQLYGSTETSVFVCVQPDGQVRDDTVGPPVAGVEIRVADNGEILVKSPGLFRSTTATAPPPRKRTAVTAGSAPATPATWTPTASSRSSTAPRTWASSPTAACSRPSTSRTSSSSSRTSRKPWPSAPAARMSAPSSTSTWKPWATGPSVAACLTPATPTWPARTRSTN